MVAGIAVTVVMTFVGMVAPNMGMAKIDLTDRVSGVMGMPIAVRWITHFIIKIAFAASYVYFFRSKLPNENNILKGVVIGIVVAFLAKITMTVKGVLSRDGCPLEINTLWDNAMNIYEHFSGGCERKLHYRTKEISQQIFKKGF